ncbi:MAG: 4-hydroxythreonine-4-phosphate dehydrogenase PdxA [Gammaproteobacteria bacterium]|nr:4-hydroxythreonine-4-phosphate dehydrogenase PdxA [Gammaproteobacteria bacterium]
MTPGEPAGIGPDLCITIAQEEWPAAMAFVTDPQLIRARARLLGLDLQTELVDSMKKLSAHRPGTMQIIPVSFPQQPEAGAPSAANSKTVLAGLEMAADACLSGSADALVTGPVNKAVLSMPELAFSGHTEFLASHAGNVVPVMLLCSEQMRVALATTHLPLSEVPAAITADRLETVLRVLHQGLQHRFSLKNPQILVCGLNPHAGEAGELGREEIDVIEPVLKKLRTESMRLTGPLPADTLFLPQNLKGCDAVLAMYHDQGLPVLKHAAFGHAVNVTLGLPYVRTSVDHGTAFDLAGTGRADCGSLRSAITMALELSNRRQR